MTKRIKPANASASATTKTTGSSTTRKRTPKEAEAKKGKIQVSINEILPTKLRLKCKNVKQKDFIKLIDEKEIVIACGPAGVGKSYVAIAKAIELMQADSSKYTTLVIIKPAVESEENLGFLPGNLKEKMEPHVASSIDIIDKLIGESARINLEEGRVIKIEPLGFIRGKTIDNTILIMEEAQNMSPNQMKTLLTRIGENTKYIISGDLDQSDKYRDVTQSGLYDAITRHKNVEEIGLFEFGEDDIVRNPLITKILKNYKKVDINVKPIAKPVLLTENKRPFVDPKTGQVDVKDLGEIKQDFFLGTPKEDKPAKKSWIQRNITW